MARAGINTIEAGSPTCMQLYKGMPSGLMQISFKENKAKKATGRACVAGAAIELRG